LWKLPNKRSTKYFAHGQRFFSLNCPLVDMSPIAVEPDFTENIAVSNNEALVKRFKKRSIVSPGKRILFSAKARDMPRGFGI